MENIEKKNIKTYKSETRLKNRKIAIRWFVVPIVILIVSFIATFITNRSITLYTDIGDEFSSVILILIHLSVQALFASTFLAIIPSVIIGIVYLNKKEYSKKFNKIILGAVLAGFFILLVFFYNVFFEARRYGFQDDVESLNYTPCSQRLAGIHSFDGQGVVCEADNTCILITKSSCPICHDVIYKCVDKYK